MRERQSFHCPLLFSSIYAFNEQIIQSPPNCAEIVGLDVGVIEGVVLGVTTASGVSGILGVPGFSGAGVAC